MCASQTLCHLSRLDPKLSCLLYLRTVKQTFSIESGVYDAFLALLKDFRLERYILFNRSFHALPKSILLSFVVSITTSGVFAWVKHSFTGHNNLLEKFSELIKVGVCLLSGSFE
jgi:Paired amphipathic helix repeat